MTVALELFSVLAVTAGAVFFLAGTVGLLRFPDPLTRLHALTKADNLGLGLVVLGLLPRMDWTARRAQARGGVAARPGGRSDGQPADRAGRPAGSAVPVTVAWAFDAVLAATVLAVAVWTIVTREAFAAVLGFVAYGLLLTLVWVRLSAPDVALTEAAIGGGLTGVLLLGAALRLPGTAAVPDGEQPGTAFRLLIGVLCGGVAAALATTMFLLPDPAPTLAPEAAANLASTGLGNPVTGVLMAYRALDTLLEKVVLVLALIGVWSLAPDPLWGGIPGLQAKVRTDDALIFLARLLPPIGIVIGVYLLWAGADQPGGAFQGGALLAAMWILTMMAALTTPPAVSDRRLRLVLIAGPAIFLAIGLAGFVLAHAFLAYPEAYAKPLIIVIELAKMLSVAATLGLLVAGPPARLPPR